MSKTASTQQESSKRPHTLLVIDDDEATRDALHKILEEAGYEVATAADGESALRALASGLKPSMIVLDLVMPRMDGWAFASRLKEHQEHRRIPVLVMTAHGSKVLSTAPVSAAYMVKPLQIGELLTTIDNCLRAAPARENRNRGSAS
jgi:DNA-binding response OmpR family regulator